MVILRIGPEKGSAHCIEEAKAVWTRFVANIGVPFGFSGLTFEELESVEVNGRAVACAFETKACREAESTRIILRDGFWQPLLDDDASATGLALSPHGMSTV